MPLGLTALADRLSSAGIRSMIMHLAIEQKLDPEFDLNRFIKENRVKIVALDLHWHPQSYAVIETAKMIKSANPDVMTVLGGFTASLFAGEILKDHKAIDFVIKGDAELPLEKLAHHILNAGPADELITIPNLAFRDGDKIVENAQSYTIDPVVFDSLKILNLSLIRNSGIYNRIYHFERTLQKAPIDRILSGQSFAYFNLGRGCTTNCSFCGGAKAAQCLINGRSDIVARSFGSAVEDLKQAKEYSIDTIYTSFDPYPGTDYYLPLFELIRKNRLELGIYFECWSLPSKAFIEAFKSTFTDGSRIIISPDCGSERARGLNRGFSYSNRELIDTLDQLNNKKIKTDVYFTLGLPFEERSDIKETEELMELIKNRYDRFFKAKIMPIELDPGSPMWSDPEKYRIKTDRTTFKDLYQAHNRTPSLGYRTDKFSEPEIIRIYRDILKKLA